MMHLSLFEGDKLREGGRELLHAWRSQPDSWLWIDLQDEARADERALLCDELGLDTLAVTEAQRPRHPPRFEPSRDHIFILLKPLTADSNDLDFSTFQLALFVAPRLLVTRHSQESPFLSILHERLRKDGGANESPLSLTVSILRRVTKRYGQVLLDLEHRLDEIEDELFETRSDALMQELVGYNTALRKMRRILAYHANVFQSLRDHHDNDSDSQWHDRFADIFNLMERFHSLSDLYQNVINDLIEGYISLNAHHLNQIMKVLTIVTVIFVPLTLLVGIYGMNFENIPELKSANGYYILLTTMAFIAGGLLLLFRRVRWL